MKASGGRGYKIPDSGGRMVTNKQPFDVFGTIKINGVLRPVYCEVKHNKRPGAFNTNRIEPHQAEWLSEFTNIPNAIVCLILGLEYGPREKYAYVFDWNWLKPKYESGHSFWLKELETLERSNVKKGTFEWKIIN
jgi:penicillin-binding protein-related factor A (putative recombinase)